MIILKIIVRLLLGSTLLWFGGSRFISSSVSLARHFKIPDTLAGVLLVGFGTSFPELLVAAIASAHQKTQIAIGNVIGSNIANVTLVLGLAALITPLAVSPRLVKREFPILIIISLIIGIFLWNDYLSRWEGGILLLLLALHVCWIVISLPNKDVAFNHDLDQDSKKSMSIHKSLIWWFLGLVLLFISSELLVNASVSVARLLGISDLVIGLTIMTIGTSLPEFAATIISAVKRHHDIAVGHIVGSNIFNCLAVLAMPALIAPGKFSRQVIFRDYPYMVGVTVLLWIFSLLTMRRGTLGRAFGCLFLVIYGIYIMLLFI